MSYKLFNIFNKTIAESDCIYDFNQFLPTPHAEPQDGDWHSLDDQIERDLNANGLFIREA